MYPPSKRSRPSQPTEKGKPHMSNAGPFTPAPVKNADTGGSHSEAVIDSQMDSEEKGTGKC